MRAGELPFAFRPSPFLFEPAAFKRAEAQLFRNYVNIFFVQSNFVPIDACLCMSARRQAAGFIYYLLSLDEMVS